MGFFFPFFLNMFVPRQTCSKCRTRRKCTKTFSIQKFPQLLVLRTWPLISLCLVMVTALTDDAYVADLKRFNVGERLRKLDTSVDFPLTDLDLSALAASDLKASAPASSYRLYGVINHSGTAYSGHYTASCRHPYSATWHEYNDSRYSPSSVPTVLGTRRWLALNVY